MNELKADYLYDDPVPPEVKNMDLWNNRLGRQYAESAGAGNDALAQAIADALDRGEGIIDPNDPNNPKYLDDRALDYWEGRVGYVPEFYSLFRPDVSVVNADPLVIDLNGDGVQLTGAAASGVYFETAGTLGAKRRRDIDKDNVNANDNHSAYLLKTAA